MAALQPLVLLAAIIGFMYFLVIRPQRKRQLEIQNLQRSLAPGDEVVTMSGIYGTVTEIEEGGTILLEIAEDTDIRIAIASITQVIKDSAPAPTQEVSSTDTPE